MYQKQDLDGLDRGTRICGLNFPLLPQNIQRVGGIVTGIDFSMPDAGDDSGIKSAAPQFFFILIDNGSPYE